MSSGPVTSSNWHRVAQLRPRLRSQARLYRHRYRGELWYLLQDPATFAGLPKSSKALIVTNTTVAALYLEPLLRSLEQALKDVREGRSQALQGHFPQEIQTLTEDFNRVLERHAATLARARQQAGNLAHAVKTPLAVLISLAGREELAAHPALRATMREQLEQIGQRLSRELGRARLAGEVLPGARFDCAQELPGLFATLSMIHDRGLSLDWQAPELLCSVP